MKKFAWFCPLSRAFFLTAIALASVHLAPISPAHAQSPMSLSVGWFPVSQAEPLFVAIDQKYFERQNLKLEPVQLQAGPQAIEATMAGAIDGALGGVVPLAFALQRQVPIKAVISIGVNLPGTHGAALIAPASSGIKSVADLKGKTVALFCRNCIMHALLVKSLREAGVSPDNVTIVTVPAPNQFLALQNQQADAAYMNEPLLTPALEAGMSVIRYEDEMFPGLDTGGWFFSTSAIEKKNPAIQAFVNGMRDAMRFISENPKEGKAILARYLKLDPALISKFGGVYFDPSGRIDTGSMSSIVEMMSSLKMIPQPLDMEKIITTEFVDKK